MEYRPLEGFVFAVSPFNFTCIGGNLSSSPALMGNTAIWKPASTAALSAYYLMRIMQEAGLPDGVINLVYGSGATIGNAALASPELAGIHFTGSTEVFNGMWETVGKNVGSYRNYPRIVGETGGKDFILAHPSADADAVATAVVRGSFEYQGQKCSAASRLYVPSNLWPEVKERLVEDVSTIKMGDPTDFENFMGAVIDASAFRTHSDAIAEARSSGAEILVGGSTDDSEGYFVEPTVISTDDKGFRLLRDELFGPIVTTYVYDEKRWDDTLHTGRRDCAVCADRCRLRRLSARRSSKRTRRSSTRRGTSTSTTSPPAQSSASSRSAARGRAGRTTRPDRSGTSSAGCRCARSRRPSSRRPTTATRSSHLMSAGDGRRRAGLASSTDADEPEDTGVIRVLDGIDAFLDQLASVDPLPVLLAVLAQLAKLTCTSMAWRNVLAAAYPREERAATFDSRCLLRRSRRERHRPDARRRRGPDLPRPSGHSGEHVHDGRLEHARPLDLRHRRRVDAARVGSHHAGRAPGPRRASRACRASSSGGSSRTRSPTELVLAALLIALVVLGIWIHGHVVDFWGRVRQAFAVLRRPVRLPALRRALAGGRLDVPPRRDLVPPRRLRHPPVGRERAARPGVGEHRDAPPAHSRRHRNRAGLPALRLQGNRAELSAPRVQRRNEARDGQHERRCRIHRDRAHAAHAAVPEGDGAVEEP